MSKRSFGWEAVPAEQPVLIQALGTTRVYDITSSKLHRTECCVSPVHCETSGSKGLSSSLASDEDLVLIMQDVLREGSTAADGKSLGEVHACIS